MASRGSGLQNCDENSNKIELNHRFKTPQMAGKSRVSGLFSKDSEMMVNFFQKNSKKMKMAVDS